MSEVRRQRDESGHASTVAHQRSVATIAARDAREMVAVVVMTLQERGPHAALGLLNARTRFRFTGIYRVDTPLLRNIDLFDRENPTVNVSGAVCRLEETYCSIAVAAGAAFATHDAEHDSRLAVHAARDSVVSYAGVPIRLSNGRVWGTVCHFDVRPRFVSDGELAVLESVAPLFGAWYAERTNAS